MALLIVISARVKIVVKFFILVFILLNNTGCNGGIEGGFPDFGLNCKKIRLNCRSECWNV